MLMQHIGVGYFGYYRATAYAMKHSLMPEIAKLRMKALNFWDKHGIRGFAPIFPDTCYHLTHYWPAAADIPVASDNPVHYADAIRYNARTPLQGSLLPLTRLV